MFLKRGIVLKKTIYNSFCKVYNAITNNPTSSKSFKHTTTVTPVPSNTPSLPSLAPFATQATMTRPSVIPRTTSSAPKSIDPTTQTTFAQKLSTASNDLCTIPPTSTLSHTQLQPPVSPKNWMSQLTNNPPTPKSPELFPPTNPQSYNLRSSTSPREL